VTDEKVKATEKIGKEAAFMTSPPVTKVDKSHISGHLPTAGAVTHGIKWPLRPRYAVFGNFLTTFLGPLLTTLKPGERRRATIRLQWLG
jgi:hypothetical protein